MSTGEEFEYAQPVATAHIGTTPALWSCLRLIETNLGFLDFSPDCLVEMIQDRYADRAEELLSRRDRIVK